MRTVFVLVVFVANALAICDLNLEQPFPVVAKRIGSKTAILKTISTLHLSINETVTFYCPQGLQLRSNSYGNSPRKINRPTVELICGEDGIYSDAQQVGQSIRDNYIKCNSPISQTLYESNNSLPGCDEDSMTLIIGYKLNGLSDVKLLAICYDLAASRLRFAKFLAYPPQNILLDMSYTNHILNDLHLDTYIGSLSAYFRYTSDSAFQQLITNQKQLGELYDSKLFEYSSLLQDQKQLKELTDYKYLLNIVWLRSLRQGNWKHFLEALRVATDDNDNKFELRMGVSGVATLPLAHRCNVSRTLQLEGNEGVALSVPAYVWAHVRSLQPAGSAADEFVLVAHNSPYVNVLELSTFCDDICGEIPWLNNSLFGELHLLPLYGVVHCCRMDQIDKLTDFPFGNQPEQEQQQQQQLYSAAEASVKTTTRKTPTALPPLI